MEYNTQTKTTDIIMCNSKNLGALIVKDEPHVKSWDEPQYSIHNIGIEESYGFGVLNEGQVQRNPLHKRSFFAFFSRSSFSLAVAGFSVYCRERGPRAPR